MPGPNHYWWHRHYHSFPRHGRPSRLLWFALGAGAFAWFSHCKDTNKSYWNHHSHGDEWKSWSGSRWGPRERIEQARAQQHPLSELEQQAMPQERQWGERQWGWGRSHRSPPLTTATPPPAPQVEQIPIPATVHAPATPAQQTHEWHAERIRETGKVASDTVSTFNDSIRSMEANSSCHVVRWPICQSKLLTRLCPASKHSKRYS